MDRGSGRAVMYLQGNWSIRKSKEAQTARRSNKIGVNVGTSLVDPQLAPKTHRALDWGSTLISRSHPLLELPCYLLWGLARICFELSWAHAVTLVERVGGLQMLETEGLHCVLYILHFPTLASHLARNQN